MRIAMLSPIAWRTPPRHYGPWENVVSLLTEGLVARGVDVTLFATGDSETNGTLYSVCARGYEEDTRIIPKVWECLHIAELFEQAERFDLIHNHFDFLPLSYSGLVRTPVLTTIHGFSSPGILPVYQRYNTRGHYVAISEADKRPSLDYVATIHHGIDLKHFTPVEKLGDYLLFFGRIHPDKGTREAIRIAELAGKRLVIAGIIQDRDYYAQYVEPALARDRVQYVGSVGPQQRDELLGGALALLHPINFAEPFGLSVIEAMACGTPVIAFEKGSMPELIRDGETGFLVHDVEAAAAAVARLHEIDRRNCRRHVESRFSVERMVEDYLALYRRLIAQHAREDSRPWGCYKVLAEAPDYKSKEITVMPGKRLSLQSHRRRDEHWLVLEGEGVATIDERQIPLKPGTAVDIPRGARHRIANTSTKAILRFIEVQTGDYFGEDDIVRYEDDFGRTGQLGRTGGLAC